MSQQDESVEFVVLFNPNYPQDETLRPHGVYLDDWAAARKVMDLLNEYYPGRWEPENLMSADKLRYRSIEARGVSGLIGYVEKRPAQLKVLQEARKRYIEEMALLKSQVEATGTKLKLIESQINALKREVSL